MEKTDNDAVEILCKEVLKYINKATKEKTVGDVTFKSVVSIVDNDWYYVQGQDGTIRKVKCCIPNVEIKVGQPVWVKMPCGNLKDMHICGVC